MDSEAYKYITACVGFGMMSVILSLSNMLVWMAGSSVLTGFILSSFQMDKGAGQVSKDSGSGKSRHDAQRVCRILWPVKQGER